MKLQAQCRTRPNDGFRPGPERYEPPCKGFLPLDENCGQEGC